MSWQKELDELKLKRELAKQMGGAEGIARQKARGKLIGNPIWTDDPRFSTVKGRKENEDEIERLIEAWTVNHSAKEVMTMFQEAGVSAGVVQTGEDLLENDPQLKHRHSFWELNHPEVGKHRVSGPSFILSKSPYKMKRAPLIGEHNQYVLKNILGISDEEIAELVIDGVIE